ncbi:MAG: Omega-amidase YafV/Nit2 [Candidatus Alkanophagales archaeon MCA70_species_1]|nr:Omega-amidase YafV/Nit2 [Candidatus Alkanophaga volatiphilum]
MEDRGDPHENIKWAYEAVVKADADFFVLPEFFAMPGGDFKKDWSVEDAYREAGKPAIRMLRRASVHFPGYLIGGSVIEKDISHFYNTCFVFRKGQLVAKYRKRHPTPEERALGIKGGDEIVTFNTEFGTAGILICADVIYERTRSEVAARSDIVFLPISLTDPTHPKVEGHPLSEKIAREFGVVVVKVSRVGTFKGKKVVSKSAVITPQGLMYEAKECEELAVINL